MKYRVYIDKELIFDTMLVDTEWCIFNAGAELEVNKACSFEFVMYPSHPKYNSYNKLKSIVELYQEDRRIFKGRVLDDEEGLYNEKRVICEGELAYMIDSIQTPFTFPSDSIKTNHQLFSFFISKHNSQVDAFKRFKVGNITVPSENLSEIKDYEYKNTFEAISTYCIDEFGGYLWTREEADGTYLDWISSFPLICGQPVRFGENIVDIIKKVNSENIYTVIIPVGKQLEKSEARLTINDLPNGTDGDYKKSGIYLESIKGVEQYGRIVRNVIWDTVKDANKLLEKAKNKLAKTIKIETSIELSAADLNAVDSSIESFHLGQNVIVYSKRHNINDRYLINKLSIDIMNPANNKLQLGATYKSFTEQQAKTNKNASSFQQAVAHNTNNIIALETNVSNYNNKVDDLGTRVSGLESISIVGQWNSLSLGPDITANSQYVSDVPQYRKVGDRIDIRACVNASWNGGTSNTVLATLPVGYRPSKGISFKTVAGSRTQIAHVHIDSEGQILLQAILMADTEIKKIQAVMINYSFYI